MTAAGAHALSGRRRGDVYKRLFSTIFVCPLLYVVVDYHARGCRKCRTAFNVRMSFLRNLPRQYPSCDPADRESQSMGRTFQLAARGAPSITCPLRQVVSSLVIPLIGEAFFIADSIKYGVRFQSQPAGSLLVQQRRIVSTSWTIERFGALADRQIWNIRLAASVPLPGEGSTGSTHRIRISMHCRRVFQCLLTRFKHARASLLHIREAPENTIVHAYARSISTFQPVTTTRCSSFS